MFTIPHFDITRSIYNLRTLSRMFVWYSAFSGKANRSSFSSRKFIWVPYLSYFNSLFLIFMIFHFTYTYVQAITLTPQYLHLSFLFSIYLRRARDYYITPATSNIVTQIVSLTGKSTKLDIYHITGQYSTFFSFCMYFICVIASMALKNLQMSKNPSRGIFFSK